MTQAHVWLLEAPSPALHPHVWRMVCAAAVHAMESGRCQLWRAHLSPEWAAMDLPGRAATITAIGQGAAAAFWLHVRDAARSLPASPIPGLALGPHHPFVAQVDGCFVAVIPAPVQPSPPSA